MQKNKQIKNTITQDVRRKPNLGKKKHGQQKNSLIKSERLQRCQIPHLETPPTQHPMGSTKLFLARLSIFKIVSPHPTLSAIMLSPCHDLHVLPTLDQCICNHLYECKPPKATHPGLLSI